MGIGPKKGDRFRNGSVIVFYIKKEAVRLYTPETAKQPRWNIRVIMVKGLHGCFWDQIDSIVLKVGLNPGIACVCYYKSRLRRVCIGDLDVAIKNRPFPELVIIWMLVVPLSRKAWSAIL